MNDSDQPVSRTAAYRIGRSMLGTVPIVLASSLVVTANVTGPLLGGAEAHPEPVKRPGVSPAPKTVFDLSTTAAVAAQPDAKATLASAIIETASAPSTYTVRQGDTVSSIAGAHGLSTASVLALNGLSWKSTIYPGQTLHLSAAGRTSSTASTTASTTATKAGSYTVVRGDTLSAIAARHGVTTSALLQANGLGVASIIYPGQKVTIPGTTGSASKATTSSSGAATTSSTSSSRYTIRSGDTLSSIARSHGTTVEKLMSANGLGWTSTIYAGKELTIPGAAATVSTAATTTTPASSSQGSVPASALDAEQRANARTIISVGRQLGVSDYGIVIALSAAAQESSLYNLSSGDRDSVGLFQQRPSQGWGSKAKLQDAAYAARLFYGGSSNPNAGKTSGLLDVSGWSRMTVTQAAQAVQRSAHPTAYAKWERSARMWLAAL